MSVQAGRQTRPSAKRPQPLRQRAPREFWPLKWRLPRSTHSRSRNKAVLCLAHITNTMGIADQDFEKGEADGTAEALMILEAVAKALRVEVPSE
jgi:hypothetical protein